MPAAFAEIDYAGVWSFARQHHRLGQHSLHGPDHWERVEAHGQRLAGATAAADIVVVRLFGILHDVERQSESFDPQHGPRAAALVRQLNGDLFAVTDEQLELLSYACQWHADGLTSDDPTIGCCWDADRLDLRRVGILPNREFMRIFRETSGAPFGLPAMEWQLAIGAFFMQTETELILKSRQVVPKLLTDSGFEFEFPDWEDACRDLCDRWRSANR